MPSNQHRVPVPGSERAPVAGARAVGPVDPGERIEVTIVVRSREAPAMREAFRDLAARPISERNYPSREEFAALHGADPTDLEKIEAFAHEHGLDVVDASVARRTVRLAGTAQALGEAFGMDLKQYEGPGGRYRGREGAMHVPTELGPIVQGVLGADDRPVAKPHFRRLEPPESAARTPAPAATAAGQIEPRAAPHAFTPPQLGKLYDFPAGVDGKGQCIAIIELGGGYRTADLTAYFSKLKMKKPSISSVSVDHGCNLPSTANSADGEVMLDIEVAGGVAPGARIIVYFAPNTDAGFLDAIKRAVHDDLHKPSVISISWGAPESQWTPQARQQMDDAFQEAGLLGVTVFCAAGDDGSSDGATSTVTDFPAASPHIMACGGTRLTANGTQIAQEVVWNDGANGGSTGGGVSTVFPKPSYQAQVNVPHPPNGQAHGRGVPDVAGDASPATGYLVRVDGQEFPIGGTSAVAPLWAGLTALLNQKLGKPVGFLNPLLYALNSSTGAFHDITTGNNDHLGNLGEYKAGPGWDACTGLGSPDGAKLLAALAAQASVPTPA